MNRKVISVLLAVVMLLSVAVPAFAQQQVDVYEGQTLVKSVAFIIGLNEYFVNDQVPGVKMDTAPFIQDGRTFVPVRFLGNALGVPDKDILWNQAERKVDMKRGDNSLSMVIGKARITVNGQAKDIDVSPKNKDKSYVNADYYPDGYIQVNIRWAPVPDIHTVTYDLSPIEKTLRAFFPDQEAKFPEIMAKAREIAEVTKQSNGFKRAEAVDYYLDGRMVQLRSDDLNFVSLIF